jgi:antitoxin ParD1/3/4
MASKVQKISIALPKEMVDDIRYAVDSGQYSSASEVVREAIRGWEGPPKKRPFPPNYPYARNMDDLRRMVQVGLDQANRGELIPAEEVFAELKARFGGSQPKTKKKKRKT